MSCRTKSGHSSNSLEIQAITSKGLALNGTDSGVTVTGLSLNFAAPTTFAVDRTGHAEECQLADLSRLSVSWSSITEAAHKLRNHRLAASAVRVRLGASMCIKKAIVDMVAKLLKEKGVEVKHQDADAYGFYTNQLQAEDLETMIKQITEATETLKADIADMQIQESHSFTRAFKPTLIKKGRTGQSQRRAQLRGFSR